MKLNARQQNVLRATVRHYVSTAEPVGSKSLASGYNLRVSAATIRNVMSALEDSGLLYQPHTSAGRIPSDSGYRAYVNELMAPSQPLTRQIESQLNQRIDQRIGLQSQALETLLQESAQILASLSGYIALVTLPQVDDATIKHLQLVRVSDDQVLLVVLDNYHNHSILLPLPRPQIAAKSSATASAEAIDRELQILSNFLSEQLRGRSLRDVVLDWSNLDQAFQRYASALQQVMADLARRSRSNPATQILVSGLAEVLDQPEFAERSQIRSLVQFLEDGRDQLWPLISTARLAEVDQVAPAGEKSAGGQISGNQRLRIWIGAENPVEPMRSCALVTSLYGSAPGPVGSLGVLGPTRMLYENAIAAVEAAANYLTEAVASTLEQDDHLPLES
jgi:heat-inducible transcriptional repressor